MNPRKLKPILDLDPLSPPDREQLWTDLQNGLSYSRAVRLLGAEHFISVKRHKLVTWWHREKDRRDLNTQLPGNLQISPDNFLDLLNAQSLPWPALIHNRILQASFLLASQDQEDLTPARLLTLQRIANNPLNCDLARQKAALEQRKQNLREQQFQFRKNPPAKPASSSRTPPTDDTFRLWTPEELAINQPKIEAAFQAHPFLRHIGLPPTDTVSPTPDLSPCFNPPLSEPTAATDSPLSKTLSETPSPDSSELSTHTAVDLINTGFQAGDWSLDIFRWTQKFFCGITRCRDHDNTSAGP